MNRRNKGRSKDIGSEERRRNFKRQGKMKGIGLKG